MWILFSFLMFLSSNILYLAIRKAQKEEISIDLYSVAMFLIPTFAYLILAKITITPLFVPLPQFLLIIFTAFFWSFLGNFFSQKGILFAPNPGYSLILQKSYVIITTIAAVFLFQSDININKIIAIILILLFSILLSTSKETQQSKQKWILFSIGAHLCFAFGSLMSKHFLNIGLQPYIYLFYISAFVSFANLLKIKNKKLISNLTQKHWLILLVIGLSSVGFNLFMQLGYKFAPNPGYVVAINTSSIMSLTFLSSLFFKDNLSKLKLVGIIGILVGLLILTFS